MDSWYRFMNGFAETVLTAFIDPKSSKLTTAQPDPYFASKKVFSLGGDNFLGFLKSKDVAMVMFYDKTEPNCAWLGKHFNKAAELTTRPGHAYAAVDCEKQSDFCMEADVSEIPCFQIFFNGQKMPFFKPDLDNFQFKHMKMWIEGHQDARAGPCQK